MRTFYLAPLYRSTVGFDRLFSMLDGFDAAVPGYPPYNIERTGENDYRISVAVAGFAERHLAERRRWSATIAELAAAGARPVLRGAGSRGVQLLNYADPARRLAAAPELPTAVEQDFPDLVAPNFIGVFAPTGVPKEVVDLVSAANLKLLADKSYQEFLISWTFELEPRTSPAEYKAYVESELARWRPIVTAMGIKID